LKKNRSVETTVSDRCEPGAAVRHQRRALGDRRIDRNRDPWDDAMTADDLLKSAVEALYQAKRSGKNTYRFAMRRRSAPHRLRCDAGVALAQRECRTMGCMESDATCVLVLI
jgi:hypothetical protein